MINLSSLLAFLAVGYVLLWTRGCGWCRLSCIFSSKFVIPFDTVAESVCASDISAGQLMSTGFAGPRPGQHGVLPQRDFSLRPRLIDRSGLLDVSVPLHVGALKEKAAEVVTTHRKTFVAATPKVLHGRVDFQFSVFHGHDTINYELTRRL